MNPDTGQRRPNRLVDQKSPYLLQHAYNPVDWYPWSNEAFDLARRENKPVFLSIGYSTCHWCHVMERESFEDDEVAQLINRVFVPIKVDREERPDIDNIYMTVCQLMTGGGGWPLTVMLTPDRRPFFAGTYFPKHGRFNRPGMMQLLPRVAELWAEKRGELDRSADEIVSVLKRYTDHTPGAVPTTQVLQAGVDQLSERYDGHHGGIGEKMKFPTPHNFSFLLRYHRRTQSSEALEMVVKTLTAMRRGGIYDQIGFGFHRYATDPEWLLPHFEKMLYDQAQLVLLYCEAWQLTGEPMFRQTAWEVLQYVLRDMSDPAGGFYSAEDADSEGVEGKFYVWSEEELRQVLSDEEAELALPLFNIVAQGNFREESTGELTGENIFHLRGGLEQQAQQRGLSASELATRWEKIRTKLFEHREERVHPYKDDKILTDWNGLMIAAFARAGRLFGSARYVDAATAAAGFVFERLYTDGRLLHRYRDGEAGLPASINDYAFMIGGLTELYRATWQESWLTRALELVATAKKHFWDGENGGYFFSADDTESLLLRQKEIYDGAIPSGNGAMLNNLLTLARICADPALEQDAMATAAAFGTRIGNMPMGHTLSLSALESVYGDPLEIVIAGPAEAEDTRAMLAELDRRFLPQAVVILHDPQAPPQTDALAWIKDHLAIDGKATAYVCRNRACQRPITELEELRKALG